MSSYISEELNNQYYDVEHLTLKRMFDQNEKDKLNGRLISADRYQGKRPVFSDNQSNLRHEMYKEVLVNDPLTNGFKLQYPHGIILSHAMCSSFYRGESQIYDASIPSLLRKLQYINSPKEKELYRFISDMRIAEFSLLLNKFEHVNKWDHCDVLYEVLAQHYGLETGWLDITNDFSTALFFATCYYDGKKWNPLTKEQTEKKETAKYGVIYHIPSNIAAVKMQASIWDEYSSHGSNSSRPVVRNHNTILPIGFQPLMRCHMQHGYGIYMRKPFPLQNDNQFEKLRFRHSEKLSKEIFERMEGGKLIYPQEGLKDIEFIIENIKTSKTFSYEAFEYALNRNHYYRCSDKDICLKDLRNMIVDGEYIKIEERHPWHLSSLRKKKIDSAYDDFSIERQYNIKVITRGISSGGAPMYAPWMIAEDETYQGVFDLEPRNIECYSLWARHMEYILSTVENAKLPDYL